MGNSSSSSSQKTQGAQLSNESNRSREGRDGDQRDKDDDAAVVEEDFEDDEVLEHDQPKRGRPSYWELIQQGYNELVNAIIRPPRCQYEISQLGPSIFDFCGKTFQRNDFDLYNPRGLRISCSMWSPIESCRPNPVLPCVIYMHGNSSARLEALSQLSLVLSLGATLLSFDFCGSGKSEGEWVSLGAFEKDDLKCVVEHLREGGTTSTIALWGRSMGAATALLHGERDPSIAGMVLDSAFSSLESLAEEMVERGRQHGLFAPGFVVAIAIRFIRSTVLKKAEFDIKDLSPIDRADKCYIPALFIAAEGDEFVPPHHSQKIYHQYAGDKNVIIVDGDHNSPRPKFMFDSVAIFLVHTLQIPEHWMLPSGQRNFNSLPWSITRNKQTANMNLTLDEILAISAAADLQSNEIGMTNERQADVHRKIYSMLGDRGNVAQKVATSGSSISPLVSAPQNSALRSVSSEIIRVPEGMDESATNWEQEETTWSCDICTLINNESQRECAACGQGRQETI